MASALAILICIGSIGVGIAFPLSFGVTAWMILLSCYSFVASGIPVWIIHQPRDFINSFILYAGVFALVLAGIVGGAKGLTFLAPPFNVAEGNAKLGPIWPILFITVACGAISGFHALVAGGTSSKQLLKESDARKVGYGGMLLEGLFAVGVTIAVASGLDFSQYSAIVFPEAAGVKSNPVLAFSLGMGGLLDRSLSIPTVYGTIFGILLVAGFLATTLDAAVRLNRYLLEELWRYLFGTPPLIFRLYFFNSFVVVSLMFVLGYSNAFLALWPIFGSGNQLLAALTLLCISVWLFNRGRSSLFAILPASFMMVTTVVSLLYLLFRSYIPQGNWMLSAVDVVLLLLSFGVIFLSFRAFAKRERALGQS